jgi:hypothetical protein
MPSHPVDVHVGVRMRQRRTLLGMSQTSLGKAVDLTFRMSNRVGLTRRDATQYRIHILY